MIWFSGSFGCFFCAVIHLRNAAGRREYGSGDAGDGYLGEDALIIRRIKITGEKTERTGSGNGQRHAETLEERQTAGKGDCEAGHHAVSAADGVFRGDFRGLAVEDSFTAGQECAFCPQGEDYMRDTAAIQLLQGRDRIFPAGEGATCQLGDFIFVGLDQGRLFPDSGDQTLVSTRTGMLASRQRRMSRP